MVKWLNVNGIVIEMEFYLAVTKLPNVTWLNKFVLNSPSY